MSDFVEYPKGSSRQIIDYNRFMTLTGNKVFICLDKGVLEICKYLLNSRGSWRTTYVKEYVGTIGYIMPSEEEFQDITNAIAEANIDMASCDDIVTAIEGVTSAIGALSSGSGGCGCVGSGGDDVTSVNDGESQDVPEGGSYPPGFSSRPEYDSYRCKFAVNILENYIQTLRNWGGLFGVVGGLTIAVITGLLLLTVPPAGLMLIMAAFGVLAGTDIGLLVNLSAIADEIEANIEELKCQIYNADSAEDVVSIIRNAASEAITVADPPFSETFLQITNNLINNDAANAIVDKDAAIDALPEEDCSECVELHWQVEVVSGVGASIVSGSLATSVVLESAYVNLFGGDREYIQLSTTTHPENFYLEIVSIPQPGSGPYTVHVYQNDIDFIAFASEDWGDLLTEIPAGSYSGIQITTNDAGVPDTFQVEFNFVE